MKLIFIGLFTLSLLAQSPTGVPSSGGGSGGAGGLCTAVGGVISGTCAATTFTAPNAANGPVVLDASGNITRNLLFTDATYDIGASGATRPRNLYLSGGSTAASFTASNAAGSFGISPGAGIGALNNIFIGGGGVTNTTGSLNSAQGVYALTYNTTGYANSAQGVSALYYNTTGYYNSAQGVNALYSNTTGSYNSANGYQAGYNASTSLATGTYNTYLGTNATANADGYTNSTALGNGATVTASNQMVFGNSSVTQTLLNGNVGIGTTTPAQALDVNGAIRVGTGSGAKRTGTIYLGDGSFTKAYGEIWNLGGGIGSEMLGTNALSSSVVGNGGFASPATGVLALFAGGTNSGYGSEKMRIDSNGNVGIGTTGPGAKLTSTGDVFVTDATKGIILTDSAAKCWRIAVAPTTGLLSTASVTCPTF